MLDWREEGQEEYLKNCLWSFSKYFIENSSNDHDHCEYCWKKFCINDPSCEHEGYQCNKGERWICSTCWNDFKNKHHLKEKGVQRQRQLTNPKPT